MQRSPRGYFASVVLDAGCLLAGALTETTAARMRARGVIRGRLLE
jgi:hypothetical protein